MKNNFVNVAVQRRLAETQQREIVNAVEQKMKMKQHVQDVVQKSKEKQKNDLVPLVNIPVWV